MVSAVFHSPRGHIQSSTVNVAMPAAQPAASQATPTPVARLAQPARDWKELGLKVFPPIIGIALLIGIWALLTIKSTTFPTPAATFAEAVKVFSDPFYIKGPNDQGIGWNILFSLERVAVGFGMAALVGIPMGFMIGRFTVLSRMVSPLISLLRPVSPLAWLPIGLLVFKAANPAAIWTIFICSIWPMIINTAVGVQRVPSDYLNVARHALHTDRGVDDHRPDRADENRPDRGWVRGLEDQQTDRQPGQRRDRTQQADQR